MEKLILIDGNSLINRAFYATPPLSSPAGVPTNAVLGFINMLIKLIGEEKPKYVLVAFDRKEPTFRHEMYPDYKGTRKPMPEDLRPQVGLLKEVLSSMNIACFEKAGVEADDIIGTATRRYLTRNVVVTGDRDSFQLVNENTAVYYTRRGISDVDVLTLDNFREKTSISPRQIIDLKALMGDGSDNIPGIPGVGEKTALDLLSKYETVEGVYENVGALTGKLKEKVENGRDLCFLSKQLATIDLNVDMDIKLGDMAFSMPFPNGAKRKFAELGFKTIIKREELFNAPEETLSPADGGFPAPKAVELKTGAEFTGLLGKTVALCFSDETNSAESVFSASDGEAEYRLKIKENFFDEGFTYEEAMHLLRPLFEDENNTVILFSSKKTRHRLSELGISVNCKTEDVSLQKYIVDNSGTEETLSDVILHYNLSPLYPAHSLYALNGILKKLLDENGQTSLYTDMELPLSRVLFDMEKTGFRVDEDIIRELNRKYKAILNELTEKIYELAGESFNVNSPKQLAAILFEKLKLYHGKKKKLSTNAEALEEIAGDHPIVPLILQYRRIAKLNSTYVEGFLPLIDKRTGLIHTVFNQTLTATGRLSSKEPNLQNLPIRDEEGREIRRFFVPSDGEHILVGADYSQIELRLLAHFSKCEILIEAYRKGEDIHALTASQVFGVPVGEVTKAMRQSAKAVNFGIIYGISEYGLAKNVKISPREAKAYIDRYFASYPHVKEYMEENVRFAKEHGYVSTLCGRKRFIRDINSPNYALRSFSERAAMNMPLQGSSADIIKIAMIRVFNRLNAEGLSSRLILQVHDELIVNTLVSEREKVEKIIKEEMENAVTLRVPLEAEVYSGASLYEAK